MLSCRVQLYSSTTPSLAAEALLSTSELAADTINQQAATIGALQKDIEQMEAEIMALKKQLSAAQCPYLFCPHHPDS